MSKEAKPYTAIPGFFEKSPQELSCSGGPTEFSPRITALARWALNLTFSEVIIEDADIETYKSNNPAVVVPPHRSLFDMSVLSHLGEVSGEGQPYFLSKIENMNNRFTAKFFSRMRTFPLDRDMPHQNWTTIFSKWSKFALSDGAIYEEYEELRTKPRKLVIFGEGTRKTGPVIESMFAGPLVAAKRNKAPIIPVGIAGTDERKFRDLRRPVVIAVGDPYQVLSIKDTDYLMQKVQEQFDRAHSMLQDL